MSDLTEYTAWEKVPDGLKTKTRLGQLGLRPAKGQQSAAVFISYIRGKRRPNTYKLYDVTEAIAKREITPAVAAALTRARQASEQARTCVYCGQVASVREYREEYERGLCARCQRRLGVASWAQAVLQDETTLILDTETTGLEYDAEIVELVLVNVKGETVFSSLVRPRRSIPDEVIGVHGIDNEAVAHAPIWPELHDRVSWLLAQAGRVVVYNAGFDRRLLDQTALAWGLEPGWRRAGFECAMLNYAEYVGEPRGGRNGSDYRWHKLADAAWGFGVDVDGAHRAEADCLMTLGVIRGLAGVGE